MPRLTMIYNGQEANKLSKELLIDAILNEYNVIGEDELGEEQAVNIRKAMEEAFRCGFLRGEEYANG